MTHFLTLQDETTAGQKTPLGTLEFLEERIPAREILRRRIYEEVLDFNTCKSAVFSGLVQPAETEHTLNGPRQKAHRTLDWEKQYHLAQQAFEASLLILLVNDRQIESLDETIRLTLDEPTEVTFLKLVPLVGG
ncbi:hypothetical protein [Deinococcus roseus]|uniref:Uncharacterized protein n=1 Tax=Deinococcus roseus TaxID=392414 RepID=A0ABQ2DBW4_9DEIO|nr:hypothetical protein [Deinococcus roseus]GGJ51792.1 hypothetical protein GCM10008938_42310 [Deinococcus roseus]